MYIEDWRSNEIWAVAHFLDDNGNLLQYKDFCEKYQIQRNVKQCDRVIKSITITVRFMVREDTLTSPLNWDSSTLKERTSVIVKWQSQNHNWKCIFTECLLPKHSKNFEHVFFYCYFEQSFWREMQSCSPKTLSYHLLHWSYFGVFVQSKNLDFVFNIMVLMGKFLFTNADTLRLNFVWIVGRMS